MTSAPCAIAADHPRPGTRMRVKRIGSAESSVASSIRLAPPGIWTTMLP
jgi:hypothetical protein